MMVSCQPLGGLFEEVERRGVDPTEFTRHIDRSLEYLSDRRNRIHWDEFRTILDHLSDCFGDEEIVDIGRHQVHTRAQRPFGLIARRFLSVGDFYRAVFSSKTGWGHPMFPCMDSTFAQLDADLFELSVTMLEGFAPSRSFVLITEGNIVGMAEWLGGAPAEVRVEPVDGGARFQVRAADAGSRLAKARRQIALPFRAKEMAADLYDAHASLRHRFDALQAALVEREQTAEALLQSQTRLRLALESVEVTLWDWDVRNNTVTVDGVGREVHPAGDGADLPGLWSYLSSVVEEDRDRIAQAAQAAFREAEPFVEQFRVVRNGQVRVLQARGQVIHDASGEPTRFVGVANDVTDEMRRTERDTRLGQVVAGAPVEIFVVDPETQRIVEANAVACEHLGYTEAELRALTLEAIVATADETTSSVFGSMVRGEIDQADGPVRHRRKDGSTYPVEVRVQRSTFEGRPALVGIALDVTDRIEAERRQRDLEAQLWQAQKLDALGTLASGVAHDFNNLLMAIRMSAEMAMSQIATESSASDHLSRIVQATERGRDLSQQILTFTTRGEPPQTPTELGPIVNEAIELLRAALPATIRLEADVADSGCIVLTGGNQVGQVVANLCTNAAQATPGMMGTVLLRLERRDLGPLDAAQFPNLRAGPHVVLTVADSGVGMSADVMERIFDPFFSTKGPDGGAGLGLAVVHGIVQAHGGAIDLESEVGIGTTIRVLLPSTDQQAAAEATLASATPRAAGRILVVDDVLDIAEALSHGLREAGYAAATFSSAVAASEAFASDPNMFDVVVTDQTMPVMNGLQLAERLRALRSGLPIVLISGLDAPIDDLEALRRSGAVEVLAKPFGLEELIASIDRLLTP